MAKNLLKNSLASAWGKLSVLGVRLLQVPLLLSTLGAEDYGRWLLLASIPSWLSLANLGFGSVSANEMAMAGAKEDWAKASRAFSTALALVGGIFLGGSLLAVVVMPFLPWALMLQGQVSRQAEFTTAAIVLTLTVFLSFFTEVFAGRFRAARKAHNAMTLSGFRPWVELGALAIAVTISRSFVALATAALIAGFVLLAAQVWWSSKVASQVSFQWKAIDRNQFSGLFRKGLSFQAFPLGNALLFQGSLIVVQSVLGPAAVALFGTTRTLVRSVNQVMEMANQVVWPEMSHLLGMGDYPNAARLHRSSVALSFMAALAATLFLTLFGAPLYAFWTHGAVELPWNVLVLFLVPIPFNALWYTSSVVHVASNQHESLAARFLLASVASLVVCYLMSGWLGVAGAALSTIVLDLLLVRFVLTESLQITKDKPSELAKSLNGDISYLWMRFKSKSRPSPHQ